ncbi:MAG: glycoside hydrolase family 108 protein [Geminicoccaceae bacterium]
MASANLERGLAHVFGHEGGLSLDPNDRGNWTTGVIGKGELKGTKFGIAAHVYPDLDIRGLTLTEAAGIYRRDYWTKIRGDLLASGIDVVMLDTAINSGPGRAIKLLQASLGVSVDGGYGPETFGAIGKVRDWAPVIRDYCRRRMSFLRALSSWVHYGNGWTRRVAETEALGIRIYLESLGRSEASIAAAAAAESEAAEKSSRRNQGAAATAGTATAADGAVLVDQTTDTAPVDTATVPLPRPNPERVPALDPAWIDWLVGGALVAGLVVVAYFLWRSHRQKVRRDAYRGIATH